MDDQLILGTLLRWNADGAEPRTRNEWMEGRRSPRSLFVQHIGSGWTMAHIFAPMSTHQGSPIDRPDIRGPNGPILRGWTQTPVH